MPRFPCSDIGAKALGTIQDLDFPCQLRHHGLMGKGFDDTLTIPLPVELYDAVGEKLGPETARAMLHAIEHSVALSTATLWHKNRHEIFQQLRQEFVTRELFEERLGVLEERMNSLRHELLGKIYETRAELLGQIEALREKTERDKAELLGHIEALREKTEKDKAELLGKIEAVRLSLDRKLTLFFVVLLSVILFTNREALELIGRLLGLLK